MSLTTLAGKLNWHMPDAVRTLTPVSQSGDGIQPAVRFAVKGTGLGLSQVFGFAKQSCQSREASNDRGWLVRIL